MSDALILELIKAITMYCTAANVDIANHRANCMDRMWKCSHNTTNSSVIVTKLNKCMKDDLERIIK